MFSNYFVYVQCTLYTCVGGVLGWILPHCVRRLHAEGIKYRRIEYRGA